MKVEWIQWLDSQGGGGWQSPADIRRCLTIESIGYLVGEDEHSVTLTTSVAQDSAAVIDPITIPKCAIVERQEVVFE